MSERVSDEAIAARAVSSGISVEAAARLMLGSQRSPEPVPEAGAVAARADEAGIAASTAALLLRNAMRVVPAEGV